MKMKLNQIVVSLRIIFEFSVFFSIKIKDIGIVLFAPSHPSFSYRVERLPLGLPGMVINTKAMSRVQMCCGNHGGCNLFVYRIK
jgi:hypothetical protein